MNLANILTSAADRAPDKIALTFEGTEVSFAGADARVEGLAEAFAGRGVGRGDRVALLLQNVPEAIYAWLAAFKRGAVVVPLNARLTPVEVGAILEDCRPRLLLMADDAAEAYGPVAESVCGLEAVTVGALGLPEGREAVAPVPVAEDELAVVAYTSGTTGTPKGVMHSHRSVGIAIDALAGFFGLGEDDPLLCVLPLHSLPSMLGGPLMAWRAGASCHLERRFEPRTCAAALQRYRPAMLGSVPTMLFDLASLPADVEVDLSSIRYVLTGGAPLAPRTREEFERRFDLRICNVYGQTEAPAVVTADPLTGDRPAGAVGRALDHVTISIRDEAGAPLAAGEVGEVCVSAARPGSYEPMLGYLGRPDATAETLRDGLLHTGDVGYLDERGFLFLVDRKNDVIVRGGVNVYPAEVERALSLHEGVQECAVFGIPSERLGEVPMAAVVARPGVTLDSDELLRWLDAQVAPYKRPTKIVLRERLPKNVLGKTLRRVLREEVLS